MKKLLTTLLLTLCAVCVCAFAGCGNATVKKTEINEQTSIIFTASNDVLKLTEDTTVEDYLKALKDKGKLAYEGSNSDYGFYITSMEGRANVDNGDGTGYSWTVYVDFTTLDGVIYASDYSTCVYGETTLYSASYGVSSMPCVEGHTYAFVYEAYDYSTWN